MKLTILFSFFISNILGRISYKTNPPSFSFNPKIPSLVEIKSLQNIFPFFRGSISLKYCFLEDSINKPFKVKIPILDLFSESLSL